MVLQYYVRFCCRILRLFRLHKVCDCQTIQKEYHGDPSVVFQVVGVPGFTPGPLPQLTSLALPARSRSTTRCSKVHRTFSLRSCPLGFKSRFHRTKKHRMADAILCFLVGVRGFEPRASWSRTKHATICATPRYQLPIRRTGQGYIICSEKSGTQLIYYRVPEMSTKYLRKYRKHGLKQRFSTCCRARRLFPRKEPCRPGSPRCPLCPACTCPRIRLRRVWAA